MDMWSDMMSAQRGKRVPTVHAGASMKQFCTARQVGISIVTVFLYSLSRRLRSMMRDDRLV